MKATKPSAKLTFHDRLSQLTFAQVCKLIGPQAKQLIALGAKIEISSTDLYRLSRDTFRLEMPLIEGEAVTTLTMSNDRRHQLQWSCSQCDDTCHHVGAMFSFVLENKTLLGLAAPPKERVPVESLKEPQLIQMAVDERKIRARSEPMRIQAADPQRPWTDYLVTSSVSGKTYRVALRGMQSGDSYCSCPDFRTNTLGTCKHLLKVESRVRRRFSAGQLKRPYRRKRLAVHLRYGKQVTLHVAPPHRVPPDLEDMLRDLVGNQVNNIPKLLRALQKLESAGHACQIYPDAEEYIQQQLHEQRIQRLVEDIRKDPAHHPLRTQLLNVPLLPYQLDGVAFAIGAGRAILADDMGLGKTIQGVGVSEMLAREAGIGKVLVVCPASLKSQWRSEIHRFCQRDVQLISGSIASRQDQYANACFFTVCNYEQVLKDYLHIERQPWDLIILDEGQRIKNWETKTSRVIKGLKSRFALVLSGTPLENRLDELYSVVQFIDDRRLGPGFRFFNRHRVVDEKGRVLGYKHLDELRQRLRPVLLRRTRESVHLQLPERTDEYVRIPASDEQKVLHDSHMQTVAQIVAKKYLTEMDMLRLRIALLMCRMSADATYLVTKQNPNYSTKLERLSELLEDLADEPDRKVILFSEWTSMLDLIEPQLKRFKLPFVRLDGSVPQTKRQALVHEFQHDAACRFFLTTNAGSTGLNLQAANTVINVDLPWNPAVLEQRIARAHRMGQNRNVQVYILVTEGTIEESLLDALAAKRDLALAALDAESEVDAVTMLSGADELKQRREILLGAKPAAEIDESVRDRQVAQLAPQQDRSDRSDPSTGETDHRRRVAAAGGELLGAAFQFLGELVNPHGAIQPSEGTVHRIRQQLDSCLELGPDESPQLRIALPNREALDQLAQTLARLLAVGEPGEQAHN